MENITIIPFLNKVNRLIINPIIELLFAIAALYFIYGIVKLLTLDAGDMKGRQESRSAIIWGIVGMVVMFSVYGLIHFVLGTFGITDVYESTGQFLRP